MALQGVSTDGTQSLRHPIDIERGSEQNLYRKLQGLPMSSALLKHNAEAIEVRLRVGPPKRRSSGPDRDRFLCTHGERQ